MYQVTGVPPNSAGRIRPTANRDQNQEIQFEYDYDPTGNRLTSTENGEQSTYVPNNLNQYDFVNGTDYAYDLNGNLTDDGTNQYEYDYENRLIAVTSAQWSVTSQYDPLGRRLSLTTDHGSLTTTLFIHDQDHIIEDYTCDIDLDPCALTRSYLYSNRIDELLRSTTYDVQSTDYYYHHDALGNTIAITDKDQNLIETYQYDPYGNPHFFDANGEPITESQIGNRYLYTGREWVEEAKLYDTRHRANSPKLGRFIQRDPYNLTNIQIENANRIFNLSSFLMSSSGMIQNPMNLHPYLYVQNNAINKTDPTGEIGTLDLILLLVILALAAQLLPHISEMMINSFTQDAPLELTMEKLKELAPLLKERKKEVEALSSELKDGSEPPTSCPVKRETSFQ